MKTTEKFYIVAERYNPQLGTYLSNVYIGKKRINKNSISCQYDYYGSSKTLRFSFELCVDNLCHEYHYCLNSGNCVYGSMNYYGFDTAEGAKAYLESKWSTHHNFNQCVSKLVA